MKKSTSDLFVSHRYGDDFNEVFTTLKEAEKATVDNNIDLAKRLTKYKFISKAPYKTMTLSEAMEEIKDYMRDYTEQQILYPEE